MSYGGGKSGWIIGIGTLKDIRVKNVFLVNNLRSNLLNISPLCDEYDYCKFNLYSCEVYDSEDRMHLKGLRHSDDYYIVKFDSLSTKLKCRLS